MSFHLHEFSHNLHSHETSNETPSALDKKALSRIAIFALVLAIIGYAFRYYNSFLLTHALSPHEYGNYSFVTSCITLASLIILFGKDKAIVKFLPGYFENKNFAEAHGFLKHLMVYLGIIFLITFLVSAALYYWTINPANRSFGYPLESYLWMTPLFALLLILSMLLRVYNYRVFSSATQSFFLFFFSVIFIKLFQYFTGGITFSQSLLTYFFSILSIILLSILVLSGKFNWHTIKQHNPIFKSAEWNKIGFQLMLSLLIITTESALISILIKFFDRSSSIPIALYNIAYMLSSIMWLPGGACASAYTPAIARAAATNDSKKLQAIQIAGTRIMVICGIILGGLLIIWGEPILRHFSESYAAGYPTLLILVCRNLLALPGGMNVYLLQYAGNTKSLMKLTFFVSFFSLLIGGFLCWQYRLIGGALTSALLQISLTFACAIAVKVKLKIKPFVIF